MWNRHCELLKVVIVAIAIYKLRYERFVMQIYRANLWRNLAQLLSQVKILLPGIALRMPSFRLPKHTKALGILLRRRYVTP